PSGSQPDRERQNFLHFFYFFISHEQKNMAYKMNGSLKRYRTEGTILLLVFVTVFLIGCKDDVDLHSDTMEIYESFLEGELTVERKEEQVHINELFWDNDIEYCFWDMDGDGNEELHLRDSVAYYTIKACDKSPQIIFESWWGHEPIAADGLCAKQAENEPEWTDRQLKSFATWQEAYIDFIHKIHAMSLDYDGKGYSLIYVDDDDIPELYIYTGTMATGEFVVTFYDGNIGVMNRERVGLQYMEYGGLLYSTAGNYGFYPCNIYTLEKGKFSEIGTGWYSENIDGENICMDYFWEDNPVTETEYEAHIEELIDTSKCIEPSVLYSKDEILEILED
ncbi:MAG: hypothetical protein K2L82_01465, partial [Lachnospiraceae bacterium]|nr:hypothetical protein [Lachnospiraceae bacterium]